MRTDIFKPTDPRVRALRESDIPEILAIERESIHAAHWDKATYLELLTNPASGRTALVIENDLGLAGFAILNCFDQECEIENLVITTAARRRGLGATLLSAMIDLARENGVLKIFLEVRESNSAARFLYSKLGFSETGRRKLYYRGPLEDAILYTLCFQHDLPIAGKVPQS